ncbi:MAG: hypothetical protein GF317_21975, partial [Candidatus Lokiarchaeota archaeon]|nr:hypothetical protein [Candidatus Lokiarchaeota archaeon]MBD3202128.1 hypothetical protein [Candidatus Lokiarchaeota archaeon]
MKKSSIKERNRQLKFKKYSNGQLCVFIEDSNGFPMAELSIMEDNVDLQENEFIYKDYSEN